MKSGHRLGDRILGVSGGVDLLSLRCLWVKKSGSHYLYRVELLVVAVGKHFEYRQLLGD